MYSNIGEPITNIGLGIFLSGLIVGVLIGYEVGKNDRRGKIIEMINNVKRLGLYNDDDNDENNEEFDF